MPVEKLNHLTRSNHQGAVGVTSAIDYVDVHEMLDNIPEGETPLIVVFDGVTDVRNFGAIARSAEMCRCTWSDPAYQELGSGKCRLDEDLGRGLKHHPC